MGREEPPLPTEGSNSLLHLCLAFLPSQPTHLSGTNLTYKLFAPKSLLTVCSGRQPT